MTCVEQMGQLLNSEIAGTAKAGYKFSHYVYTNSDSRRMVENREFFIPHLYSTSSVGRSPSECCHNFGKEKLEWRGYSRIK